MFNYNKIIRQYASHQGYCLGLESYHRLKGSIQRADGYLILASDFNKLILKVKIRALKRGVNKSELENEIFEGIQCGKLDASDKVC